jgi:hemoglobin
MSSRNSVFILVACLGCASSTPEHEPPPPTTTATSSASSRPAAASAAPAAGQGKSLFDRLGGLPAVEAVVADFAGNVIADEKINVTFAVTDLDLFKKHLVEFVCAATGGPCKYAGLSMKAAHENMGVTGAQFDALVGDLVKTLDKFHVPEREKGELLGALAPLKKDIVEVE